MIGTRFDPATPYEGAVATARRFRGSRLLTVAGVGHTSAAVPNSCVDAALSGYLVQGRLPAADTTCRQRQAAFS